MAILPKSLPSYLLLASIYSSKMECNWMNRIITFTAALILVWITGYLLIAGRGLLIPIVISIFVWHLLNTINSGVQKIPFIGTHLPSWISMILSLFVVVCLVMILINIITNNVSDVIAASPRYQENLLHIFNNLDQRFHVKGIFDFDSLIQGFSIQSMLVNIYGVFTTITSSAVLISLYVVFLFVEQHYFTQKMDAFFPQEEHRKLVKNIISHITKDTQTYLGIKTLLSLLTATLSWFIMKWVGLDFAEFWALLIFFLNYIPNIGAIVATAFPAALALIQFESWWPFLEVTSGIVAIQFFVGNFLEPRLLGKSLNLSPLVILFALALWGAIWGVLGMFLSVPITVMMMIIFAHFDVTRPIAILLSQDGYIHKSYESLEN
ncbi:TPA: AI-2E family transporter [Legionella pneumophila]|uniref:AI-2E family transporter n=3 Tax=Legionella pneumophila TaxID=446 RepID=A0A2S6EXW0_LEGPN|nr:AI-2E family transporter [Legionella pneumophila]RYB40186.1 AI-2E family transporter [Legionella pneumophila]RYW28508.1 AI-2E family transporter [Legionella pneumophila]TIH00303.1 AI-2E family transporter [Legionella pneumophila]HAT6362675.1 AI-2E family transporter [Legionella pneumophila]